MAQTAPVAVIGAGGLGEEVRDAVVAAGRTFVGFLDDADRAETIGRVEPGAVPHEAVAIMAIGDPETRLTLAARFGSFGRWAVVIHPSAVVSPRSVVGSGTFVGPLSYVGPLASIGRHVIVNVHAEVGHHVTVANFVTLSPLVAVNGSASVGEGAFLGTTAAVGPGVSVGAWSRVAAGSHVTADCGDGHLMHGNPAKGRQLFRLPDQASNEMPV